MMLANRRCPRVRSCLYDCIKATFRVKFTGLMQSVAQQIEAKYKKSQVVDVQSGDTVRVHQKIREGGKERGADL